MRPNKQVVVTLVALLSLALSGELMAQSVPGPAAPPTAFKSLGQPPLWKPYVGGIGGATRLSSSPVPGRWSATATSSC